MMLLAIILLYGLGEAEVFSQQIGTAAPLDVQRIQPSIGVLTQLNDPIVDQNCNGANASSLRMIPALDPDLRFEPATRVKWDRTNCDHFTATSFCKLASDQPFWALTEELQRRRQTNALLRQQIFSHLNSYFNNTVSDTAILEACCGFAEPPIRCGSQCEQNAACQRRLGRTTLRVVPGSGPGDNTGNYHATSQEIIVSEPLVLNSLYPEANQQLILHELGHACQDARHHTNRPDSSRLGYYHPTFDCDDDTEAWTDMQELLPATATCLRAPLTRLAIERNQQPGNHSACRNSWAAEAFADAIFSFRQTNPRAWARNCTSPPDFYHGPFSPILDCIIPRPAAATTVISTTLWENYCHSVRR